MKDLTVSKIERLNVLNNRFAIEKIQKTLDITGMMFDGEYRFTKKMVADFYEVEERTIERYLENFGSELSGNGYVLCKGKRLKDLKLQFAPVINVGSKTTQLGLFNFRSFLNLRIMTCFMNGEDYDEELKIDIANAMSRGELGVRGEDYE